MDMADMGAELRVAEIWRYPVKSMAGERIDEAEIARRGVLWDRGWAVRDERVGAIRSARYLPRLLLCSARYLPGTNAGMVPHVEIALPDGSTVVSDDLHVNKRLSDAIGRELSIHSIGSLDEDQISQQAAFETGGFESEMRMIFGLKDDELLPDMEVMMEEAGKSDIFMRTFHDSFAINILTTSSIRYLQSLVPNADLNIQRFRTNFLVDDQGDRDFEREMEWIGKSVRLGGAVVDVIAGCARCTILAAKQQGGIPRDSTITRTVVREMQQKISVYCNVRENGLVRAGELVTVLQ